MFSRAAQIFRRHLSERKHYARTSDWLLSIYNRILIHAPAFPLPARRRLRSVRLRSVTGPPLQVRLATSDWYVLEEIFLHGEYQRVAADFKDLRTIVDLGANVGMSVR